MEYGVRTRHSKEYYKRVILVLAEGVADGFTHAEIAGFLNEKGIRTQTGGGWKASDVNQCVNRFRRGTGVFYTAMLKLHFDGNLTKAEVMPLLRQATM